MCIWAKKLIQASCCSSESLINGSCLHAHFGCLVAQVHKFKQFEELPLNTLSATLWTHASFNYLNISLVRAVDALNIFVATLTFMLHRALKFRRRAVVFEL